jgi:subtilisin family serine protease
VTKIGGPTPSLRLGKTSRNKGETMTDLSTLVCGQREFRSINKFYLMIGGFFWLSSASAAVLPIADQDLFGKQWALNNEGQNICDQDGVCKDGLRNIDIRALDAWHSGTDCSRARVAILDTGVDLTHPELSSTVRAGANFVDSVQSVQDDNSHGSHVAGIIAATGGNGSGVSGVCKTADVLAVKIADAYGRLSDSDIVAGIDYARQAGAKVVNASFGGPGASSAVRDAIAKGSFLFIAAAGNGDRRGIGYSIDERPTYPASFSLPNMMVVAASDNQDRLGTFSNFGARTVNIAAPGVGILSTTPRGETAFMGQVGIKQIHDFFDGTSMATPYVVGAVALYWSNHPTATAAQVKAQILQSADRVPAFSGKLSTPARLNLLRLMNAS